MEETQKKSFSPTLLIVVVVLLLAGGYYFLNSSKSQNKPQQPAEEKVVVSPTAAAMEKESPAFTVEGAPFYFKPNEIRVKKGDTVKITFKNVKGFHDFVLDEFNVRTKQIQAGESETVEFVADKIGTFEFYCSVANHRQQGMKGNLIVE